MFAGIYLRYRSFSFFNWRVSFKRVHETCAGSTSQWRPLGPASPLVQSGVRAFPPAKSLAGFLLRRDIKKKNKKHKKKVKKPKTKKNMLKTNKNQTKKMPEGALGHCGPRGGWFFGAPDLSCLCVSEASRAPFPHLIVVSATHAGPRYNFCNVWGRNNSARRQYCCPLRRTCSRAMVLSRGILEVPARTPMLSFRSLYWCDRPQARGLRGFVPRGCGVPGCEAVRPRRVRSLL